jgi:uncharacterized membrane protein YeiB
MATGNGIDPGIGLTRVEFWQRAAALAFGLWAIMIPVGVGMIRNVVAELVEHDRQQADQMSAYVLAMERRVTLIEERQQRVLQTIAEHQAQITELRLHNGK